MAAGWKVHESLLRRESRRTVNVFSLNQGTVRSPDATHRPEMHKCTIVVVIFLQTINSPHSSSVVSAEGAAALIFPRLNEVFSCCRRSSRARDSPLDGPICLLMSVINRKHILLLFCLEHPSRHRSWYFLKTCSLLNKPTQWNRGSSWFLFARIC